MRHGCRKSRREYRDVLSTAGLRVRGDVRGKSGSAGPVCRGKTFGYFLAFEKVTRPRGRNKKHPNTPKRRRNTGYLGDSLRSPFGPR